jgi:hypothetical protein
MQIKTLAMRKRNIGQFLTKPQRRRENADTSLAFTMPRETAARLKQIAAAANISVQELLTVAAGEWLARHPDASGIGVRQTACG